MSDLIRKITNDRSGFEKLMMRVPGYKGYKEMSDRRDADRMVREFVVRGLKEQMQLFISAEKKMITGGGLSWADKTHTAKSGFQHFIDRLNAAMPGYSGFYDSKKIGTDELDRVYQFDAALVDYIEKFKDAVAAFAQAATDKDKIDAAISGVETVATDANQTLNQRVDLFTGLSGS